MEQRIDPVRWWRDGHTISVGVRRGWTAGDNLLGDLLNNLFGVVRRCRLGADNVLPQLLGAVGSSGI